MGVWSYVQCGWGEDSELRRAQTWSCISGHDYGCRFGDFSLQRTSGIRASAVLTTQELLPGVRGCDSKRRRDAHQMGALSKFGVVSWAPSSANALEANGASF